MPHKSSTRWFSWYFGTNLLTRILLGLVLGAIVGLVFRQHILWLQPFGDVFIRLLQMIVMPIIISTLVVGAASISPANLGRSGVKIIIYYTLTSAVAVAIGLVMGNIFRAGSSLHLSGSEDIAGKALDQPSLSTTLMNIVPTNFFDSLSSGAVLPVIFFSILFGIGLSYLRISDDERIKTSGDTLFKIFEAVVEIMFLIIRWILEYAPIGVFALIAVVFAKQSGSVISSLVMVIVAVYVGLIVHLFVMYGSALALNKLNIRVFLRKARLAMVTAFVTRSSGGTLPVTMKASDNMGASRKISSFTLPLGATINMDGTAIYQGICALFIGFAVGLPLTFGQQMTVIVTAVLASIGTAGVPGAGAIMLLIVLKSVGLDVSDGTAVAAAYAMILGVDAILDMGRTSLNITGDLVGTVLVAKSEDEFSEQQWRNPEQSS